MNDPFFASITPADGDHLKGEFTVNGQKVFMHFASSELDAARAMAMVIQQKIDVIAAKLAEDVVDDVYDDVDPLPTAAEIAARISLRNLSFSDGVGAECFFNDCGFFGGNDPCVWIEQDGQIGEGHIAG